MLPGIIIPTFHVQNGLMIICSKSLGAEGAEAMDKPQPLKTSLQSQHLPPACCPSPASDAHQWQNPHWCTFTASAWFQRGSFQDKSLTCVWETILVCPERHPQFIRMVLIRNAPTCPQPHKVLTKKGMGKISEQKGDSLVHLLSLCKQRIRSTFRDKQKCQTEKEQGHANILFHPKDSIKKIKRKGKDEIIFLLRKEWWSHVYPQVHLLQNSLISNWLNAECSDLASDRLDSNQATGTSEPWDLEQVPRPLLHYVFFCKMEMVKRINYKNVLLMCDTAQT